MEKNEKTDYEKVFNALSLAAVLLAFSYLVYDGLTQHPYFLPTYDNAMLHAGRARVILDTGRWAEAELVFGGVTKSYHLPFHPALAAGLSSLTGLSLWWSIRLLSFLFTALLLPLAFYLLGKALTGRWTAGVAAALAALALPPLMTWGSRTTPLGVGTVLVPLGLYFVARKDYGLALLAGLAMAVNHQPSMLSFGLSFFVFFCAVVARKAFGHVKGLKAKQLAHELAPLFLIGFLTLAVYMAWHVRQTGFSCLDFSCMPQLSSHEYGASVDLTQLFSLPARVLALGGLLALGLTRRFDFEHKLLLFSWFAALLFLVKNDVVGIGVFTERFLTFFDEAVAVLAGVFVAGVYSLAEAVASREK